MNFVAKAAPGKMKHTFTGLRPEFSNIHIHLIILERFCPLRREIMKRVEGGSESGFLEPLRTTILEGIDAYAADIRMYTAQTGVTPQAGIEERQQQRADFGIQALDKALSRACIPKSARCCWRSSMPACGVTPVCAVYIRISAAYASMPSRMVVLNGSRNPDSLPPSTRFMISRRSGQNRSRMIK